MLETVEQVKAREWLKKRRSESGMTAEEVASAVGITRGHYSMIEGGRKNPSMGVAFKLGARLGFDPAYFIES